MKDSTLKLFSQLKFCLQLIFRNSRDKAQDYLIKKNEVFFKELYLHK